MIKMTDNLYEFRKYILEDLNKEGYKYIARDSTGALYAYSNQPSKQSWACWFSIHTDGKDAENISRLSPIFADIKWEDTEPFEITCINWKEVPVDAPVVCTVGDKNRILHFCKYNEENDRVVLYKDGRTSFTEHGIIETYPEMVSIYEKEKN